VLEILRAEDEAFTAKFRASILDRNARENFVPFATAIAPFLDRYR